MQLTNWDRYIFFPVLGQNPSYRRPVRHRIKEMILLNRQTRLTVSRAIQRHNSIHAGVQPQSRTSPLMSSGTAHQPKSNSLDHKQENMTVTPAPTLTDTMNSIPAGSAPWIPRVINNLFHNTQRQQIRLGRQNPGKELTETKLDRNQGGLLGWKLGRPVKKRQIMGSQSKN